MSSPQLVLEPTAAEGRDLFPSAIQARDMTASPEMRPVWRRRRSAQAEAMLNPARAPGWPSPMGFWLEDLADRSSTIPAGSHQIQILPPGTETTAGHEIAGTPRTGRIGRPVQTVRMKGMDGELVLTIGDQTAQVVASPATWNVLSEPVLLAICQYWRFQALDTEIDRLTVEAEGDLNHAAMAVPASLWDRKRLLAHARSVRALLLDLPHFEGPITDPLPYLSTERAVASYRLLVEKLHLDEWCEAIDDRAEAVEDAYASVTEKLNEFRNFAVGSTLEIAIIAILVVDLFVNLANYFVE
ncbi:MAG: hypothetical protein JWN86_1024 [Planctomycetota bacterium]|nr:hypothetical protein [Planctomycetota bacterium]